MEKFPLTTQKIMSDRGDEGTVEGFLIFGDVAEWPVKKTAKSRSLVINDCEHTGMVNTIYVERDGNTEAWCEPCWIMNRIASFKGYV